MPQEQEGTFMTLAQTHGISFTSACVQFNSQWYVQSSYACTPALTSVNLVPHPTCPAVPLKLVRKSY